MSINTTNPTGRTHWAFLALIGLFIFLNSFMSPHLHAGETPAKNDPVVIREKTVYVPYEKLNETFEKNGRGVFLPYQEFVKLWNTTKPVQPTVKPVKPPADAVITGGSYVGVAGKTVARFKVTYEVKALAKSWCELSLPLQNVAVEKVSVSDSSAVFAPKGKGYVLIMPKPGTYTVNLSFAVRIDAKPGQRSFSFGIPPTAVSRLELTIPEKNMQVDLVPKMAATTTTPEEGKTKVLAFIGNAGNVTVTWKPPIGKATKAQALITATQLIHAELGERVLRINSAIGFKIERNEADRFQIRLPEKMRLLSVKGPNIQTWTTDNGVLDIRLHSSVKSRYNLGLRFERILEKTPEKLAIPFPKVEGVLREEGYIAITNEAALRVRVQNSKGLSQIDPNELPAGFKRASLLAGYRYLAHPLTLDLSIQQIQPEVRSNVHGVIALGLDDDTLSGWATLRIAKVGIFTVRLRFNKRWEPSSIGDEKTVEDFTTSTEGEYKIVTVNLKNKAKGSFRLPFKLSGAGRAAPGEIQVAPVAVLDTLQDKGIFGISAPKAYKLTTLEKSGAVPANARLLYEAILQTNLPRDQKIPLAFSYNRHPVTAKVSLEKRKTEVRVSGYHAVSVSESGLKASHTLEYLIEYAGADTLRFSAPATLDDKLHIECPNLKEKKKGPVANGRRIWEIVLQEKTLGAVSMRIDYTLPLDGLEPEKPQEVLLPDFRAEGVDGEQGFWAVRKEGSLEIEADAKNLEQLESSSLPVRLRERNNYLAYRYFQPDHALTLKLIRHNRVELASKVVDLLRETYVLSEEKTLMVKSELFVENAKGDQHLVIRLPEDSKIRSLAVNGVAAVPLQNKKGETLIKLPIGGPFPIELIYFRKLSGAEGSKLGTFGSLKFTTLEVLENVPVNKVELNLFLPEDYAYMGFSGTLHRRREFDHTSNTFAWIRDALIHKSQKAQMIRDDTSQFQTPRRPLGKFTTAGKLYRFQTLAAEGTLNFWYCGRKLFWLFDLTIFILALVLGWHLTVKRKVSELWVGAGFVAVPLCFGWFMTSDAGELPAAWLAAGIVLSLIFIWKKARALTGSWRESRLVIEDDPFLENADGEGTISVPQENIQNEVAQEESVEGEEKENENQQDAPQQRNKKQNKKNKNKNGGNKKQDGGNG